MWNFFTHLWDCRLGNHSFWGAYFHWVVLFKKTPKCSPNSSLLLFHQSFNKLLVVDAEKCVSKIVWTVLGFYCFVFQISLIHFQQVFCQLCPKLFKWLRIYFHTYLARWLFTIKGVLWLHSFPGTAKDRQTEKAV